MKISEVESPCSAGPLDTPSVYGLTKGFGERICAPAIPLPATKPKSNTT